MRGGVTRSGLGVHSLCRKPNIPFPGRPEAAHSSFGPFLFWASLLLPGFGLSGEREQAEAEAPGVVEPALLDPQAGGARQLERLLERVLERVFGVDRLAAGELDLEVERVDPDALRASAHDLDLDPPLLLAPGRAVREAADVEAGVELAVHALEQVQREARGDAGR